MSIDDISEVCERVRVWLTEEGLFKEEMPSDEKLHFQIAAEYPSGSGRHLSIIQPKDHADMIIVFSRIRLADAHQMALSEMPPKARERLIWQMRYDLLFRDSSFEIEPGKGELKSIRFMREIYYDGLNKNQLMQAVRENFKCELYIVWKFQEVFGDGQNGRASAPPEPMYS